MHRHQKTPPPSTEDFTRFLGVDELFDSLNEISEANPGACELTTIGSSRLGDPIHALTVWGGPAHAIVFGGVHPNEPIGGLTCLRLARELVSGRHLGGELGCTWHIIPCIDPDGTRLNEDWFEGELSRSRYGRGFYRPAPDEQVEWTFPLNYKRLHFDRPMPETRALMDLIDKTEPAFMASLHNGEYGGVFYYVTDTDDALTARLTQIPAEAGLPLDTGEGEAPFVERLAPAIYRGMRIEDAYDYVESHGQDPSIQLAGSSSADYARPYGTFYLATEVPYWANEEFDDHTPTEVGYADALREHAAELAEVADLMAGTLAEVEPDLSRDSPFLRASRAFAQYVRSDAEQTLARADLTDPDRRADRAEIASHRATTEAVRLRYAGMLVRALNGEIAVGNATPAIRSGYREVKRLHDAWSEQADRSSRAETIAISTLVRVQYEAVIACARHALG